ncbi:MAG: histidine phosphatase family protein [Ilumatobacter sp.]|nr:MAG: histidine phosphatase family protein [Ilumatobacter sp.]
MEIVLVRHAEPEWIREGLNVVNPPLTDRGHRQAERLAEALAGEEFDEVLVSPLTRTRQTAAPVLEALGHAENIDPWLEEIRDPGWHGTPAEKAEQAYREMRERPVDHRWAGIEDGEPVRDFVDRIRLGITLFLSERGVERAEHDLPIWKISEPGARILLIAHAGTNSVCISHLLGLEPTPWEWDRFVLGHTSISRLEAISVHDSHTFSLTKLSDTEHLDADHRTR